MEPSAQRTTRRRFGWAVAAGVGVTALAIGAVALGRPTPAYALGGDGELIELTINRLEGAASLEQAFADRGITADITYTDPGTMCAPGRYEDVGTSGRDVSMEVGTTGEGSQTFRFPAAMVGDGETLVISSSWTGTDTADPDDDVWTIEIGVARGPIAACEQVTVQTPPR